MLQPKQVPPKTLSNLIPPNRDYGYFAGAGFDGNDRLPFRHSSTQFELANATWLVDAALLVYADEVFVREQFARAGIHTVRAFPGKGTQCFVASTDDFAIIAFRGTQIRKKGEDTTWSDVFRDIVSDAKILLVDWTEGGSVHKGFKDALNEVWNDQDGQEGLNAYLDALTGGSNRRSLWFTGHSLGAALATLAAHRYGRAAGVYTYGSPCVGNQAFAQAFRLPTYRLVNATDGVTLGLVSGPYRPLRIPPIGRYVHVGLLKYIRTNGTMDDDTGMSQRVTDWLRGTFKQPGFAAFADHAPLFYATHIWNACAQAYNSKGATL